MMNYTEWMEHNLPGFERANTAYTAALVNRVKQACRVWTLIARISLLGLALIIADTAHKAFELEILRSIASGAILTAALLTGILLGYAAQFLIVTSRIRKLVNTSALSDIAP